MNLLHWRIAHDSETGERVYYNTHLSVHCYTLLDVVRLTWRGEEQIREDVRAAMAEGWEPERRELKDKA